MYHVSESQIKKVAVRFLRDYYKDRPRQGNTTTGYDMSCEGNVIIDGHLQYVKEDGGNFLATFEASCVEKRDEVVYRFRKRKILLESFAIASAIVLFGLAIKLTYYHYIISYQNLKWTLINGGGILLGLWILAAILINRAHRFRYIYAVEQFKRYHADEQWIAIADDVFESPEDKCLQELKKQCIKNGFGLMSVNPKLEGQMLITASRSELFKNKRNAISRFDNGMMDKLKVNKIASALSSFKNRFKRKSRNTTSTNRFRNFNYWPALTSFLTVVGIGSLFYFQLRDTSIVYVKDELGYRNKLSKFKGKKEHQNYIIDTLAMENYPFSSGIHGVLSELDYLEDAAIPENEDELAAVFHGMEETQNVKFLITVENGSYYTYNCERLFHFKGTNYLLQDNVFKMWSNAFNRIRFLKEKGIYAHAIQTSCFDDKNPEYIVFYEIIFDKKREAEAAFPEYIGELESAEIVTSDAVIRELQF